MYNNLIVTRINNLVSKFQGDNYNNECFYRDFESNKRGLNYAIGIYVNDNDYSYFHLFSRGEDTEDDPKLIKKW